MASAARARAASPRHVSARAPPRLTARRRLVPAPPRRPRPPGRRVLVSSDAAAAAPPADGADDLDDLAPAPSPPPPGASSSSSFTLDCPHFAECPGCVASERLDEPPTLARARRFFASRGVRDFRASTGATRGWRARARLAARSLPKPNGRPGRGPLALGLFQRGTHDLVRIPECAVHHPRVNDAAAAVERACRELGIRAYDEATGEGDLRYVQLTAVASEARGHLTPDRDPSASVQIGLVWNEDAPPELVRCSDASSGRMEWSFEDASSRELEERESLEELESLEEDRTRLDRSLIPPRASALADRLAEEPSSLTHSVWVNFNAGRDNVIASPHWALARGDALAWATHGDARVCYHPGSFMQSNAAQYDALLAALRRAVPRGAAVSEMYAGAGAIGLSVVAADARRAEEEEEEEARGGDSNATTTTPSPSSPIASLRCVEVARAALETFRHSAAALPDRARRRVRFQVARAEDAARDAVEGADVVVVDPPRKGLDARTLAALAGGAAVAETMIGKKSAAGGEDPDPRWGKQGAAGSGRKKRNRRVRRKKKKSEGGVVLGADGGGAASWSSWSSDADFLWETPPPPARLETLAYVSCGFASFERDADVLVNSGEWVIESAEGFNFFPGGDALEVLAIFRRTKKKPSSSAAGPGPGPGPAREAFLSGERRDAS